MKKIVECAFLSFPEIVDRNKKSKKTKLMPADLEKLTMSAQEDAGKRFVGYDNHKSLQAVSHT